MNNTDQQKPTIFIAGIGTNVGKTLVATIVTEALEANYWKPIQAGYNEGTDTEFVSSLISNNRSKVFAESYKLEKAASPHIAAKEEAITINLDAIVNDYNKINNLQDNLIIEGAGGLLVPLNANEFVIDLIKTVNAKVILVSRNYLGSINHSLLSAAICKQYNIDVLGWIFNDQYLNYEEEIVEWSGYPKICTIPFAHNIDKVFVKTKANEIRDKLISLLK